MRKFVTASALLATLALPAVAQTPSNRSNAAMDAPATHDTAGNPAGSGYNSASARNPTLTDNGGMRASKIVGSAVYNDHDEKIGSVDDLIIRDDKAARVVLSVGGFLGLGSKLVEVPFDKLQFGNTKGSSDNRVVIPGVSKESLNGMPDFQYTNRS